MADFDVFVSYAHADRPRALVLRDCLTSHGLKVWLDDDGIDTFASISAAIATGLKHSKALLAVYSHTYPLRRACQWELTAAFLAVQGQGGDARERVLIVNPEHDAGHVHPIELRDALHARAPGLGDRAGWDALAARVAAYVNSLEGVLGELGVGVRPRWFGRSAVGAARFVGRIQDMWEIHSALSAPAVGLISGQSTGDPAVKVAGMGGIGKSLLAHEYALRYAAAYPGGLFWLRAHGHEPAASTLPASEARDTRRDSQLLAFAVDLGLYTTGLSPEDVPGVLARELDARGEAFLWVIDDLPGGLDSAMLEQWLAPGRYGRSLLTTRGREYAAMGAQINLEVLTMREGLELLARHRSIDGPEEQQAAVGLVEDLGGHALALDVAGAGLAAERGVRTYGQYRAALSDPRADELEFAAQLGDQLPGGHEASIAGTLMRSIEQLDEHSLDFLRLASILAGEPIPPHLVIDVFAQADGLDATAARRRAVAGMQAAATRSLAEPTADGDARQVHTLVARTIRLREGASVRAATLADAATRTLTHALKTQAQEHTVADSVLLAHARHLAAPLQDVQRAELLHTVAMHDYLRGDYLSARALDERVLESMRPVLGDEHPNTLETMNNLAETLRCLGDLGGARVLHEQTLTVRRRVLGDEHPVTLKSISNLALVLQEQGELARARRLQQHVLPICRQVLGDEHPDTLRSMSNLAATLRQLGDLNGARRLQEPELVISRRVLGDEHPETLASMNNLATTLCDQGDLAGARSLHEQALAIRRRVLGDEHPTTLLTINNLAATLHEQGDLAGARTLQEQTLAVQRRVLGGEHPATLTSMNNLANMLHKQGDPAGARTLYEQALAISPRMLGGEHPDTLGLARALDRLNPTSANWRGRMQRKQRERGGRVDESHGREAELPAADAERDPAGEPHPLVAAAEERGIPVVAADPWELSIALGAQAAEAGNADVAAEIFLSGARRGPPHTAPIAAFNLGILLSGQGDVDGACTAYRQAAESGHPEVAPKAALNLGVLLSEQGDVDGAWPAFQQAAESSHSDVVPKAVMELGMLLAEQGDLDASCAAFRQALAYPEHAPTAAFNLGILLYRQGDVDGACEAYRQAAESGQPEVATKAASNLRALLSASG